MWGLHVDETFGQCAMQIWTIQRTSSYMHVSAPWRQRCRVSLICTSLHCHGRDVESYNSAGGSTVQQAFEQVALAMFNYMTPLSGVSIDPSSTR